MPYRWHQDLKPTNILVVRSASGSPFAYTYRITDFGLCRFKTIMEGEEEASDLDMFGTITYGTTLVSPVERTHH